ncbi:MAG: hypothetical protein ABI666_12915 [Ferruginibacter sp.]
MKILTIIAGFFFLTALSSCIDMEENIVINSDNSGTYSVSIDMGKMITMLKQMGQDKETEVKAFEKKDSTIYLKDLILATDSLTSAEKELYKDGFVHIKADEANGEMKIVMTCPFKKIGQLPEIKENFLKVLDKLKAFDNISDKSKDPEMQEGKGEMANKLMTPGNSKNYAFTAEPGKITNAIINIEDYKKEILTDSMATAMQQLTAIIGEMTYKTTITTPKEIKKYSGSNAGLSESKKTITFKNTFTDMIEHPEKLSYKVEY